MVIVNSLNFDTGGLLRGISLPLQTQQLPKLFAGIERFAVKC